jgi:hypothetical protein
MVKVRHGPVLDVFVIVASYLMLTATVASAATVRIYSGGAPISDVPFSPGNLVDTDISLSNGNLLFSAVNGTPATIEGIWLYKCRNKNPYECMASSVVVVESFPGNADASYSWGDVSAGSPVETANLLYFVKLNRNGKTIWETFWTSVRKEYGSVTVIDEDVSNIEVHLSDGMDRKTVIDFIKNFLMIPANPGWVEKVVIQGAHTVYEISMTGENDIVVQPNTAGYQVHESYEIYYDEIGLLTGDYGFLFPEFSNVKNAITLFQTPHLPAGCSGARATREKLPATAAWTVVVKRVITVTEKTGAGSRVA